MIVYLDNSATTKPFDEVINEMNLAMSNHFANPSSTHKLGLNVEKKIKESKKIIKKAIGASNGDIIFTSGATESNNMAILGVANNLKKRGKHIITTKIEHDSVLACCNSLEKQGFDISYLPVDNYGRINLDDLKNEIREDTILVSIIHVNNEVGIIQPIKQIAKILQDQNHKIHFHLDAVQSFEKIDFNVKDLDIDTMSISAHKIHGPKGIGALYIKNGINLNPIIYGGGQENGYRSGTENTFGIIGFAKAVQILEQSKIQNFKKLIALKKMLYDEISQIDNIRVNSLMNDEASPHILNVSFNGVRGEVLLHTLEMDNIFVSMGSACSSNKNKKYSHVLESMGLNKDQKEGAIRFSLSHELEEEQIIFAIEKIKKSVEELRSIIKGRI